VYNSYFELIDQTYDFPQTSFDLQDNLLQFNGIDLMPLIEQYGTPLRLTYLPRISQQIKRARQLFGNAIKKHNYSGQYLYSYCTKSNHFRFVLEEVLKNNVQLELSSSYDVDLTYRLLEKGILKRDSWIICNGYKTERYIKRIKELIENEKFRAIPVLDNLEEIKAFDNFNETIDFGIRIAAEEEPRFEFYTSRLGIRYSQILDLYREQIKPHSNRNLRMLHFFINTGIRDDIYYWNELNKVLKIYCALKKECPELDMLNIGGGLPVQSSLSFDYDYDYMISEIVNQINIACKEANVAPPHIVTEFGNFTVAESGATIFKVIGEKQQNDREKWYMIDNSLMTTLPDIYGINQKFVMLPINKWDAPYQDINIGGLSCDGMDYYNSEVHLNRLNLPKLDNQQPLYLGFFHTGAYQESLSGFGGIKHCLMPSPKHIVIQKNNNGELETEVFSQHQQPEQMLDILGY